MRETAFETYEEARAAAQERANRSGLEVGVWCTEILGEGGVWWCVRFLPKRSMRFGIDAQCEVVMPEVTK